MPLIVWNYLITQNFIKNDALNFDLSDFFLVSNNFTLRLFYKSSGTDIIMPGYRSEASMLFN